MKLNKNTKPENENNKEMNRIKWDEKYFEASGLYIWIYNNGALVCTNNRYRKSLNLNSFKIHTPKRILKAPDKAITKEKN